MISEDLVRFSTRTKEEIIDRTKSSMTFEVLNQLLKLKLVSAKDLSLFIGRWKTVVRETKGVVYPNPTSYKSYILDNIYSNEYRETDWASHNISLLEQE